jgi:hypothetical protein
LKLFHRNDHHIEMTCHPQHLGGYLEGQGHSMTLQQYRVRPITLLFEFRFYNYFTEMITILRQCVARITLKLPEVYLHVSKTYLGSITRFKRLLFFWVVAGVQGQIGVGCPNTDTATCGTAHITDQISSVSLNGRCF